MAAEQESLPYTLCVVTGAAFMFNVILLAWHCLKFQDAPWLRLLKYSCCCLDVSYVCTTVALSLLILYKDLEADGLCNVGGVLVLYATQQSLWDIAACSVCLLLWRRSCRQAWQPTSEPGWARPVFVLVMLVKFVLVIVISVIPQTGIDHFDAPYSEYYLCTPLRLPDEQSWGYSVLMLALHWIALAVSGLAVAVTVVGQCRSRPVKTLPPNAWFAATTDQRKRHELMLKTSIILSCNVLCWLLTLLVTSVSYFSQGDVDQSHVKWTLGFCIGLTVLIHPAITFVLNYVVRKGKLSCCCCSRAAAGMEKGLDSCPRSLHSLVNYEESQPVEGINKFLVQWYSKNDQQLWSGMMKAFSLPAQSKWRNEVNALAKMDPAGHPNIAQYAWTSRRNHFSAAICTITGLTLGAETSLICRAHYSNGTLRQFLDSSIQRVTEVSLHKVILDIASGLEYMHQRHLVHNGLTTHTVLMASVSEKVGLRVVLSDFENSYEVPADSPADGGLPRENGPAGPGRHLSDLQACHVFAIAEQMHDGALQSNKFAPDIRSFGLIILEILVSVGEYNQGRAEYRQRIGSRVSHVTRKAAEGARHGSAQPAKSANSELTPHCHGPNVACTCSTKVTEIRVCKDKDDELKLLPRFLPDLQADNVSQDRSENTMSLASTSGVFTDTTSSDSGNDNTSDSTRCHCPRDTGSSQWRHLPPELYPGNFGQSECTDSSVEGGRTSSVRKADDACATSIASLVSFETIYEDQEHGNVSAVHKKGMYSKNPALPLSGACISTRRLPKQPPLLRKKAGDLQGAARSKRLSASSLDESIASLDSGLGSSHFDVHSEKGLVMHPSLSTSPVYRDVLYSVESPTSDGEGCSTVKSCVDANSGVLADAMFEGPESNVDGSPVLRDVVDDDAPSNPKGVDYDIGENEGDFGLPDLRLRKQPCVATHPHVCPGHGTLLAAAQSEEQPHHSGPDRKADTEQCNENLSASFAPQGSREDKPPRAMSDHVAGMDDSGGTLRTHQSHDQQSLRSGASMDASVQTSNQFLCEENHQDGVLDRMDRASSSAFTPPPCLHCPNCGKDKRSMDGPSPSSGVLEGQARRCSGRSSTALPKLGVSAYRTRRLSDCSLVSSNSRASSAAQLDDGVTTPRPVHVTSSRPGDVGHQLQYAIRALAKTRPEVGIRGRASSVTSDSASTASVGRHSQAGQVSRSATSSVLSILQDSKMLIDSLYNEASRGVVPAPRGEPRGSSAESAAATRWRTGLGPGQVTYCQQLVKRHPALLRSAALMTDPSQQNMQGMLTGVKKKGHLGFTAGQLLPLLSDCWLQDPAPSAEDILSRLDRVLPTAVV